MILKKNYFHDIVYLTKHHFLKKNKSFNYQRRKTEYLKFLTIIRSLPLTIISENDRLESSHTSFVVDEKQILYIESVLAWSRKHLFHDTSAEIMFLEVKK